MLNKIKEKFTKAMDSMYDYMGDHPMTTIVLSYGCSMIGVALGIHMQNKQTRETRKFRNVLETTNQLLANQK